MRNLPVPTILALIGSATAANAMEVVPARTQALTSPAAAVMDKSSPETPVNVGDIGVVPAGNLGSADGKLKIHLKGLVAGAYDSNLFATEKDPQDDVYLRVLAGMEAVYRVDDRIGFGAEVISDNQAFSKHSERDLHGGQARVRGAYKGDTLAGNLTLDYTLIDDPDVQTGERIKRQAYGANTAWLREMLGGGIAVNADVHRSQYLEDQSGFVAKDRNESLYVAGARYIHQQNERSSCWARVGFVAEDYDTDNRLQDVTAVAAAVGADLAFGDRATFFAEAGVDSRSYKAEFALGYDDADIVAPIASVGLYYPVNDKGTLVAARAFTEARNSIRSNAVQVTGIILNGRQPMSDKITAVAAVSVLYLTDYASAPGVDVSERQTYAGSLGAEYALRDGIVLRATGRYTQAEAKLANEADYNRFEGVVETAFAF